MIHAGWITTIFAWTVVHAGYFVPDFYESGTERPLTGRFFLEYNRNEEDPRSSGRLVLDFDEKKAQRLWMDRTSQNDDDEEGAKDSLTQWLHDLKLEQLSDEDGHLELLGHTEFLRHPKNDGVLGSPEDDGLLGSPSPQEPQRAPLLKSIDWVDLGAVTEAREQGTCGSCWAMSLIGYIEGKLFNILAEHGNGVLVRLSPQFLMDCSRGFGQLDACHGGNLRDAITWVKQNGLCEESQYPFVCKDMNSPQCKNSQCRASCNKILKPAHIDNLMSLKPGSLSLKMALMYGPSMGVIDGSSARLLNWTGSEVIPSSACPERKQPNHGILVVGYGYSLRDGKHYWKIKNVWGKSWAEDGFGYLERGEPGVDDELNTCGILDLILIAKWAPALRTTPMHQQAVYW